MLNNKKTAIGFICFGIVAIIAALIVSVVFRQPQSNYSTDIPHELDEAVALSIYSLNGVSASDIEIDGEIVHFAEIRDSEAFPDIECLGVGHVTLGYSEKGNSVDVYALCSDFGYGFRDGVFVDESGSSCIPTLIKFDKTDDGNYIFKEAQEAKDGSDFVPSINKMFPAVLAKKAISAQSDEETFDLMQDQCDSCAAGYLKAIGREAKIGSYSEEDYKLLSDYGVSDEVCNELLKIRGEYGFLLGNFERIEKGVRYVYDVKWDGDNNGTGTLTYSKSEYDSGKVVKKYTYKVEGDSFSEVKPKKKKK